MRFSKMWGRGYEQPSDSAERGSRRPGRALFLSAGNPASPRGPIWTGSPHSGPSAPETGLPPETLFSLGNNDWSGRGAVIDRCHRSGRLVLRRITVARKCLALRQTEPSALKQFQEGDQVRMRASCVTVILTLPNTVSGTVKYRY